MKTDSMPRHSQAFRTRRFLNWFPLGLSYALLYMGRYNLTVAKTSLGVLMTKEDFGMIFGAGTVVYAFAFLLNGPLVDRFGGRFGMLIAVGGSALSNFLLGGVLTLALGSHDVTQYPLRQVFSFLYALNMYFQSFGAVSIVKVNAQWFHVRERGGFSGVFGTMISSGIFLAFTVNGWFLDLATKVWPGQRVEWVVFHAPALLLTAIFFVELMLLKDTPADAGLGRFDTGDVSSGEKDEKPIPTMELIRQILTNPIILTLAAIEFCTGVLRNGVMHWFPIYVKEVWALPNNHLLQFGSWDYWGVTLGMFAVAAVSAFLASRAKSQSKATLITFSALAFLAPFIQAGWGGILFIAGVLGGNVAGWVSDLFFQSRRAPVAGLLYILVFVSSIGMCVTLATPTTVVSWAKPESGLQAGDKIVSIVGVENPEGWAKIGTAFACVQPVCKESTWDSVQCMCTTEHLSAVPVASSPPSQGPIPAVVERGGQLVHLELKDPKPVQRAGDKRYLEARPVLPMSPYALGFVVFLISLCVIGTHGVLTGTATMDFGGRKGVATAVGVIDGFVYLGTALQSVALGYLTTRSWSYWPYFLMPFSVIGFLLLLKIWHAVPTKKASHA